MGQTLCTVDQVDTNLRAQAAEVGLRQVQEALTNAVRHANAKNIDVILEQRDGKTVVIVEDDGTGFDTRSIGKSGHLGLVGMQERAQMIGARITIESDFGCGTIIVLEVQYGN